MPLLLLHCTYVSKAATQNWLTCRQTNSHLSCYCWALT